MKKRIKLVMLLLIINLALTSNASAEKSVKLLTINWEPYTGEKLPNQGFFSHFVTESFERTGYKVQFLYRSWARALLEAKEGKFDGLLVVYWKKERTEFLKYSDVVWKVKEEFITLEENQIAYSGDLSSLTNYKIGALNSSLQAEEIEAAGINVQLVSDQIQNVRMLLLGRIDAVLIPRDIFFHHLEQINPKTDRSMIKVLKPPYKIYDMYVVFSRKRSACEKLTTDFNRGLSLIKDDGTFQRIIEKHKINY